MHLKCKPAALCAQKIILEGSFSVSGFPHRVRERIQC